MSKNKPKRKITYTITDNMGAVLTKWEFIKALLWAVFVYAVGIFILAAIVIVILFFIFKFNILIPLLIAVPVSLVMGVVTLLITILYDNRPSKKRISSDKTNESSMNDHKSHRKE